MADKDDDKDIETPERDSTEDKAVEIGKKIETATGEKEEIPDFEVTEESADGADDARLSKDKRADHEGKREHKELSNREKRQLKKKRIAEKFDAKDNLIRQQQDQLNVMAARLNDVDGRLSNFDQAQFTQVWNSSVEAFQSAERKHQEAFSNGDGAKATEAMREMYQAQRRIDDLEALRGRQGQQQPQKPQGHDPRVVNKAKEWAARNEWFKPNAGDDDSAIADAIAMKLMKEGYDPKTDDYYEELDERLAKKGIGQQDDDEDDDEPAPRKPAQRRGPPVGGSSGGGRGDIGSSKQQVTLPTAFINTLKDNGYWDDLPKRNKMIAGYLKGVKERGEAR